MNRLENHLRSVFPGLGSEAYALKCIQSDPAHPTMNIRELSPVHRVEDPSRQRRSKIAVEHRHRIILDKAPESRAHHELRSRSKSRHEQSYIAKIVGTIRIAHQNVASTNVG